MPNVYQPTRYEVTATKPGQPTYLIGYSPRISRRGLADMIQDRGPWIVVILDISPDTLIGIEMRPRIHATVSGWTIGYTGRTQREARQQGAHPFIANQPQEAGSCLSLN